MEIQGNRTTLIIVVALMALLVGCCCGVLIGGLGASLIGLRTIEQSGPAPLPEFNVAPILPQAPEPSAPDPSAPEPSAPELRGLSGAYVREVGMDSPAEQAGIRAGDLIVAVDDTPLDAHHALADVLGQYRPGDRVTLTVVREDAEAQTKVNVRLGESPDHPGRPYLGIWFMDVGR